MPAAVVNCSTLNPLRLVDETKGCAPELVKPPAPVPFSCEGQAATRVPAGVLRRDSSETQMSMLARNTASCAGLHRTGTTVGVTLNEAVPDGVAVVDADAVREDD